jgi:hypothetical protein
VTLRRVSRQAVEALVQDPNPLRRVSRASVEVLAQAQNPLRRISRVGLEALVLDVGTHVFFSVKPQGGDLPADFGNAETGTIEVRTQGENITTETMQLYARLFQADEITPLSNEVLVATETGDDGWTNNTIVFTGIDTTADKATWDAARVRFRWSAV